MSKNLLVIFDIDGTLLFSNKVDSRLFAEVFESRYAQPFPSMDWEYFPHVSDHTIFNTAYSEAHGGSMPSAAEVKAFQDDFVSSIEKARQLRPAEFQPVPGVQSLFEALAATPGYEVAIATGGWERPAKVKLSHVGLLHEELVISAADGMPTREDIVNQAKARSRAKGYAWDREVYIGDALWDVRTCANLGMPFIGLRREGDHEILHQAGTGKVFSDYLKQTAFFEALDSASIPLRKS